tara:strand:- start:7124 stop:7942 length:819 start_codon:yes stop_codon:yes gene_type:complete
MQNIIIQLICPDQKGIIAQLTSILYESNNNILSIEQYVDQENKKFYIRILTENNGINREYYTNLGALSKKLNGELSIFNANRKRNVAIMCSIEQEHVYDLLIKHKSNQLNCNVPIIISNHDNIGDVAEQFDINFKKINTCDGLGSILQENKIDVVVLARFMQLIPSDIVNKYPNKIINIHHGFLPAFKGARPYRQAYNKGVKLIGATSHYVTEELDEGPIICQDVIHINHKHSITELSKLGREIEKTVLYKAVKSHLEHKIIVHDNKTIIFD